MTCSLTSINSNICTGCPDITTSFRVNTPGSTPACPCSTGYYDSGAQICGKCQDSCITCINPSTCSSCHASRVLLNSQCVCPIKFYAATSSTCSSCHLTCLTCSGSLINQCSGCSASRQLNSITAKCDCKPGFYDESTPGAECSSCHFSCQTCSAIGDSSCDSCSGSSHRTYDSTLKTCKCLPKYYDDGMNQLCQSCHYSCKTCLLPNPTRCASCDDSLTINRATNPNITTYLCDCPERFYDNGIN